MHGLVVVTPPAEEPVSLAEAKAHLRVDHAAEDALITSLIAAARQLLEQKIDQAIVARTLRQTMRGFDAKPAARDGDRIRLYLPPLISVSSVRYRDEAGTVQTLAPSGYVVDAAGTSGPGWIEPAPGVSWPSTQDHPAAVEIEYVAGYGAASAVPEMIKAACKLIVGHLYLNREAVVTGTIATELPLGIQDFVNSLRTPYFA